MTVHDRSKASTAALQWVRGALLLLVAAAASGAFDLSDHAAPRPLLKHIKKSVSYSIDSKKIGVSVSAENGVLGLTLVSIETLDFV